MKWTKMHSKWSWHKGSAHVHTEVAATGRWEWGVQGRSSALGPGKTRRS